MSWLVEQSSGLTRGILSLLGQIRYAEKRACIEPSALRSTDSEVSTQDHIRLKDPLSALREQEHHQDAGTVPMQRISYKIFSAVPYLAQGFEAVVASLLAALLVLDK